MQQLRVQLPELLEVHLHQAGHIVPGVCRAPPWNRKGNGLKRRGLGRAGQGRASRAGWEVGQEAWTAGRAGPWEAWAAPASRPHHSCVILCAVLDTLRDTLLWIMRAR